MSKYKESSLTHMMTMQPIVYVRIHNAGKCEDETLHNYHKLLPTDEGWRVKQNKSQPSAVSRVAEWLCENPPAE